MIVCLTMIPITAPAPLTGVFFLIGLAPPSRDKALRDHPRENLTCCRYPEVSRGRCFARHRHRRSKTLQGSGSHPRHGRRPRHTPRRQDDSQNPKSRRKAIPNPTKATVFESMARTPSSRKSIGMRRKGRVGALAMGTPQIPVQNREHRSILPWGQVASCVAGLAGPQPRAATEPGPALGGWSWQPFT